MKMQSKLRLLELRPTTAAGDRFERSRGRSIESIDSIDSIIFRSLAKFLKNRSRRDDRFRQKIVKIRAILAIFRPFEDFGDFRFDRFDIFFDSIDTEPNDRWGPPCPFNNTFWYISLFRNLFPISSAICLALFEIDHSNCRNLFEDFGPVRTCSDTFGCVRMCWAYLGKCPK